MFARICTSVAVALILFSIVAESARAITIDGKVYYDVFELKNISLSSCGSKLHTGPEFNLPERLSVSPDEFTNFLTALDYRVTSIFINEVNRDGDFTDGTNPGSMINVDGGIINVKGIFNNTEVDIFTGTYQTAPFFLDDNENYVWNTLINVTSGLFFDFFGGSEHTNNILPMYQQASIPFDGWLAEDFSAKDGIFKFYAVPEPGTVSLLLAGLLAGAGVKRRREAA